MGKNNIIWWILGILALILIVSNINTQTTSLSALPNDLKLTREQFPLIYDFSLTTGTSTIRLNDGVNLNNVYLVKYRVRGCWNDYGQNTNSESLILNEFRTDYSFTSCEFLTYSDGGDGSEYIHYQEKEFTLTTFLDTHDLSIFISTTSDMSVIERTLSVYEYVDCRVSSQCPLILVNDEELQPFCDVNAHQCSLEIIPITNTGTPPTQIISPEPENDYTIYYIIAFVVLLLLIYLWRRK